MLFPVLTSCTSFNASNTIVNIVTIVKIATNKNTKTDCLPVFLTNAFEPVTPIQNLCLFVKSYRK